MRVLDMDEYRLDSEMVRSGDVVLDYGDKVYVYEGEEVVAIGTSDNGTLCVLLTNGQLAMHNRVTDCLLAQQVPFEKYLAGPSDGNELLAVWNEWKQKESQA